MIGLVVFDGGYQTPAVFGMDQQGVTVASFEVYHAYFGNIGTWQTPLRIAAENLEYHGRGALYYESTCSGKRLVTTYFNSRDSIGAQLSGWLGNVFVFNGGVSIQPNAVVNELTISGSQFPYPIAEILSPGPSIPRIGLNYGEIVNQRPVEAGHRIAIGNGNFFQQELMDDRSEVLQFGGSFSYQPPITPDGEPYGYFYGGQVQIQGDATFRYGFITSDVYMIPSHPTFVEPFIRHLLFFDYDLPDHSFLDRNDDDGDGTYNVFDACSASPIPPTDADNDCRITLKDFASFQNAMSGP